MFRGIMTVETATKAYRITCILFTASVLLLWSSESFTPIMRWWCGILILTSLNMFLHTWLPKRNQP